MPRIRLFFVAAFVLSSGLRALAALPDSFAEPASLEDRIDEQSRQIAMMTDYSAQLEQILRRAGVATGQTAQKLTLRQKMDQNLPRAHCDNRPLADAINALGRVAQIQINVDWKSLADGGITKTTLVSCELRDCSVESALRTLLTAGRNGMPVAISLANHAVNVTTAEHAATHTASKIYDLRPYVSSKTSSREILEAIVKVITESVAPDSWRDSGGSVGSLSLNGYEMAVTQTPENLALIDDLLDELNADRASAHRHDRLEQQEGLIVALDDQIAGLIARCRSAGIRVPPRVDRAMLLALPEIRFVGTPLSRCLESLGGASGQVIDLNIAALEEAGIDPRCPVTLTLSGRTLAESLTLVLARAVAGNRLQYRVKDDAIIVSTRGDLSDVVTHVHDVRDLVVGAWNRQEAIDDLVKAITSTIEPDSWRDAGGSIGGIRELQGQLIITQTESAHRQIKKFLDARRRQRKIGVTPTSH